MLDFDSKGRVIGIEVLDLRERMLRAAAAASQFQLLGRESPIVAERAAETIAAAWPRNALAAYRETGPRFQSTHHLTLLAQPLDVCAHRVEGLAAPREAAALVEETGERYAESEIRRREGNLLLAAPPLEGLAENGLALDPLGFGIDVREADFDVFGPKRHESHMHHVESAVAGSGIVTDHGEEVGWRYVPGIAIRWGRPARPATRKLRISSPFGKNPLR